MDFLQNFLASFEKYLDTNKISKYPFTLYEPIQYILDIGGKRIRPALLLMAYDVCGGKKLEEAMPAAMALELFHNFTLMHDDIMDNAFLRRGTETVHIKYDVNTAILSGDAMMIYTNKCLEEYEAAMQKKLLKVFNQMALEVCEGQRLDLDFEQKHLAVSIESYLKMIEFKTSVLLAASLRMGAIIADASEAVQHHFYQFGLNIGIAFQIQDDILDTFGVESEIGKKVGGDILQNKKTYLYLKALELGGTEDIKQLEHWYLSDTLHVENEKIDSVVSIFKKLGVDEYAFQLRDSYRDLAISHLKALPLDQNNINNLESFANFLAGRKF